MIRVAELPLLNTRPPFTIKVEPDAKVLMFDVFETVITVVEPVLPVGPTMIRPAPPIAMVPPVI
jgi:hypothetical protein